MTLIRAECSMISAQDDLSVRSGQGLAGCSHHERGRTQIGRNSCCPRSLWVPCGGGGVKADHLLPSQMRAPSWALARSSGLKVASAPPSGGSPLPAVFAIIWHFSASTLFIVAPSPLNHTPPSPLRAIRLV